MARTSAYILLLLVLFHVASNTLIVARHETPQQADAAHYLSASLEMHERLRGGDIKGALRTHDRYGAFFFYLTQPLYLLFGRSLASAVFINNIFFALLIVSTFHLGKELFSEGTGLLAAFLVSFYPQVYGMSRVYLFDFALTAMICLDLYLLVKTKDFTDRRVSIFLGIALGLSALVKPAFVIFMVGPVLISLFMDGKPSLNPLTIKAKAKNFLLALAISLLLYSTWFLGNHRLVLRDTIRTITVDFIGIEYPFWHLQNVLHWPTVMLEYQVLYFFFILFVVAMASFFITRKIDVKTKLLLTSFIALPYCFFTFIVLYNKDARFILPLTIGISLISAAFVTTLRHQRIKALAIALAVVVGLGQYWVLSYGGMDYCRDEKGVLFDYFGAFTTLKPMNEWQYGIFRPSTNQQGLDKALAAITDDAESGGQDRIVLATRAFFTPLRYLKYLKEARNLTFHLIVNPDVFPEEYRREYDYVLLLNEPGEGGLCLGEPGAGELESLRLFEEKKGSYALLESIKSYPCALPCGESGSPYTLEVYRRIE